MNPTKAMPKTKYQLARRIEQLSNPSFKLFEVVDTQSARDIEKQIKILSRNKSVSVIVLW
jgi:hypothetical protein